MTEIQPFTFPTTGQAVRTLLVDGEPWFVSADVTEILGYANGRDAVGRLVDEEDRREYRRSEAVGIPYPFDDLRIQSVSLINESGLYSLVLRSNVLGAREFKRWVTSEVLPAIRKTGSYSLPRLELTRKQLAQMVIEAEEALEAQRERADRAEFQALEMAPAARAWDTFREAHGDYSVREAAQILSRDPRIETGQQRLFRYLREAGWLDRANLPYQRQIDCGRLALKSSSWEDPDGDEHTSRQPRVTVKGIEELHKLLGGTAQFQALMSEEVAA
jgi:prophage antirepressor-like protein